MIEKLTTKTQCISIGQLARTLEHIHAQAVYNYGKLWPIADYTFTCIHTIVELLHSNNDNVKQLQDMISEERQQLVKRHRIGKKRYDNTAKTQLIEIIDYILFQCAFIIAYRDIERCVAMYPDTVIHYATVNGEDIATHREYRELFPYMLGSRAYCLLSEKPL